MKTRTLFYLAAVAVIACALSTLLDHADAMRSDVLARSASMLGGN